MTVHEQEIVRLQTQCAHHYSLRMDCSLADAISTFNAYHIFEYIAECYDYLHLSGLPYIVDDIADRIERGVDFV